MAGRAPLRAAVLAAGLILVAGGVGPARAQDASAPDSAAPAGDASDSAPNPAAEPGTGPRPDMPRPGGSSSDMQPNTAPGLGPAPAPGPAEEAAPAPNPGGGWHPGCAGELYGV